MSAAVGTKARVAIELENGDIYSRHNAIETIAHPVGTATPRSRSRLDDNWAQRQ